MALVYIGIGSNMGNREWYLSEAIRLIKETPGVEPVAESSILETSAVDFTEQPDFLNQVVIVKTSVSPPELLEILKGYEVQLGRVRRFNKGPREIDLDILLYDQLVLKSDCLEIPHPGIVKRDFVLKHIVEMNPDLKEPGTGIKYSDILGMSMKQQ